MKKNQSGFTLIEIAIVMVIIGLLLGGVLKGQAMINSAKVRSLNNGVDGITAAWFAFQDRYRALPGDMTIATAAAQINATITTGGDGLGTISSAAETGALWRHLALAGFISGTYAGTPGPAPGGAVYSCTTGTGATGICPDNRFGLGHVIATSAITFGAPAATTLFTGSNIPVDIISELDRKIDDGAPLTGSVRGGTTSGAAAACVAAGLYALGNAALDCGLAIRNL